MNWWTRFVRKLMKLDEPRHPIDTDPVSVDCMEGIIVGMVIYAETSGGTGGEADSGGD